MVSFLTRTESTGTSSVTVHVSVVADRYDIGEPVTVTTARLIMVAVDAAGKPIPFAAPPSVNR